MSRDRGVETIESLEGVEGTGAGYEMAHNLADLEDRGLRGDEAAALDLLLRRGCELSIRERIGRKDIPERKTKKFLGL